MKKKQRIIKVSELDLTSKIIKIKRVTKVIEGGRILSFSALAILGDKKNVVGFGFGKAKGIAEAIEKAKNNAQKNLMKVAILNGTIPHDIKSKYKGSYVFLKPAAQGTGIIAGGVVRAILETAGVSNVLTKARGSNNPHNVSLATLNALKALRDPYSIAKKRGISLEKVFKG